MNRKKTKEKESIRDKARVMGVITETFRDYRNTRIIYIFAPLIDPFIKLAKIEEKD